MLVLFLLVTLIWIWFQLGSDNVREWAATKVGSAVDRRVTIKEPLGLAFLPTPTIVIHQLSIAGLSGDSSDFITADTIEISIALRPLIRGSIVISRLVLAGVTIVLDKDEGARLGRSDKNLHDDAVTSAPPYLRLRYASSCFEMSRYTIDVAIPQAATCCLCGRERWRSSQPSDPSYREWGIPKGSRQS